MLKYRFKQDDSTDYPDWENTKLSNIADITMGQSPSSKSYNNDKTGLPLLQGNADINNYYTLAEKYSSQPTKICEKNDVIMTVRAPVGELGIASEKSCLGRGVCSLRSKYGNNLYIFYLLQANKIKWKKTEVGSTYKAVDKKSLQEFKVSVPLATEEQQKIADFLSAVDNQIDIQRQRVEVMETQKKSLLDKVFSQKLRFTKDDGSDYPEWKEENYENLLNTVTGKLDSNAMVDNGIYPFFTCSAEPYRINTYAFDCDAILLAGNNAQGNFHVNRYKGKFNAYQRTYVITAKNNCNLGFIQYYLELNLLKLKQKSVGSTTKFLTMKILNNLNFLLPCPEEQQKIADFFTAIDNQIDIEKHRLIAMETIKKGLLQQMFC